MQYISANINKETEFQPFRVELGGFGPDLRVHVHHVDRWYNRHALGNEYAVDRDVVAADTIRSVRIYLMYMYTHLTFTQHGT